jgi:hypothetical protein
VEVRKERERGVEARKDIRGRYLDGIILAEHELQSVHLALVQRVLIHDPDVHEPFLEIVCFDEVDTRWKIGAQLWSCYKLSFQQRAF